MKVTEKEKEDKRGFNREVVFTLHKGVYAGTKPQGWREGGRESFINMLSFNTEYLEVRVNW